MIFLLSLLIVSQSLCKWIFQKNIYLFLVNPKTNLPFFEIHIFAFDIFIYYTLFYISKLIIRNELYLFDFVFIGFHINTCL